MSRGTFWLLIVCLLPVESIGGLFQSPRRQAAQPLAVGGPFIPYQYDPVPNRVIRGPITYVTNTAPRMPGAVSALGITQIIGRRMPTNWIASVLSWDVPPTNGAIYEVQGGRTDAMTNFDTVGVNSNGTYTMARIGSALPCWFAVRLSNGAWGNWSPRFYFQCPMWPIVQSYYDSNGPCVAWVAPASGTYDLVAIGSTNAVTSLSAGSNELVRTLLPTSYPPGYRVRTP